MEIERLLLIIGTGIKSISHLTREAEINIRKAEQVLYLVNDPCMKQWIYQETTNSFSLDELYSSSNKRADNYKKISDFVLSESQNYKTTAFVTYGHPSIFCQPTTEIISGAGSSLHVHVLPSIASDLCLFADLGIDPSQQGWQEFEATDFVIRERQFNSTAHLILWQVGTLGNMAHPQLKRVISEKKMVLLTSPLIQEYGAKHTAYIYEAAIYPHATPMIKKTSLDALSKQEFSPLSTVYVPPKPLPKINTVLRDKLLSF